ncbi:MAG: GLUG motif-containing protein, partial [Candidatus Paceibacterota bacterium]
VGGTIARSSSSGDVAVAGTRGTKARGGGLVGQSSGGSITLSHSSSNVSGGSTLGGLVGHNYTPIQDSYATGEVAGSITNTGVFGHEVGGLVGYGEGTISSSYATGPVTGKMAVGGLVGDAGGTNLYSGSGIINSSYATGEVSGGGYVGGLVGKANGTIITSSYALGDVQGGAVGGLVGYTLNLTSIENSFATGNVRGGGYSNQDYSDGQNERLLDLLQSGAGGLVGRVEMGTIRSSFAVGTVNRGLVAGGLVGAIRSGTVYDSYALGCVADGIASTGGLVGYIANIGTPQYESGENNPTPAAVYRSYAAGKVEGDLYVGGFIGRKGTDGARGVADSFWDIQTTGQATSEGGTGKTTPDMVSLSTYTNTQTEGLDEPWDFNTIWRMTDGQDYPYFENKYSVCTDAEVPSSTEPPPPFPSTDVPVQKIDQYGNSVDGWDISIEREGTLISSCVDLQNIQDDLTGDYYLDEDINCSGTPFTPIGSQSGAFSIGSSFRGTFDGAGNSIRNLQIDRSGKYAVGLFGSASGAKIQNVVLENVSVVGGSRTGGLVGYLIDSSVTNARVTGTVSGAADVGGLIGRSDGSTILHGQASGDVSGSTYTGGLVGRNSGSSWSGSPSLISRSTFDGSVNSSGSTVGGLVGINDQGSTVTRSHSAGEVRGQTRIGGLVGRNLGQIRDTYSQADVRGVDQSALASQPSAGGLIGSGLSSGIENSYAIGNVTSDGAVGGFIGENKFGSLSDSFSTGNVSLDSVSGGFAGINRASSGNAGIEGIHNSRWWNHPGNPGTCTSGTYPDPGEDCVAVSLEAYFFNRLSSPMDTWDFNSVWKNEENDYPTLWHIGYREIDSLNDTSVTTDSNGWATLSDVPLGTYGITEESRAGWASIGVEQYTISVDSNGSWSILSPIGAGSNITFQNDSSAGAQDGQCGADDGGGPFENASEIDEQCDFGSASSISGTSQWEWTCAGINGGADASCTASKSAIAPDGVVSCELIAGGDPALINRQITWEASYTPAVGGAADSYRWYVNNELVSGGASGTFNITYSTVGNKFMEVEAIVEGQVADRAACTPSPLQVRFNPNYIEL